MEIARVGDEQAGEVEIAFVGEEQSGETDISCGCCATQLISDGRPVPLPY